MTVSEFLKTLPESKREDMADFLYGRVPCRLGLVARTGIEPVVSALKGQRVKPITLPGQEKSIPQEFGK